MRRSCVSRSSSTRPYKKKDEVTVVESEQNWKKVRTADGVIGYVKNKTLKNEEKKNITRKFEEQDYSNISKDYTINMAWHNVTNQDANNAVAQRIAQTKGLTTLAPTWIHVADTNGNISSIASADYVSYAHKQNVEVWMTVRDFDGGISSEQESYELLSYTSRRETLITQLIAEALRVGVDGINVDFEKISDKCGEHYIEFTHVNYTDIETSDGPAGPLDFSIPEMHSEQCSSFYYNCGIAVLPALW